MPARPLRSAAPTTPTAIMRMPILATATRRAARPVCTPMPRVASTACKSSVVFTCMCNAGPSTFLLLLSKGVDAGDCLASPVAVQPKGSSDMMSGVVSTCIPLRPADRWAGSGRCCDTAAGEPAAAFQRAMLLKKPLAWHSLISLSAALLQSCATLRMARSAARRPGRSARPCSTTAARAAASVSPACCQGAVLARCPLCGFEVAVSRKCMQQAALGHVCTHSSVSPAAYELQPTKCAATAVAASLPTATTMAPVPSAATLDVSVDWRESAHCYPLRGEMINLPPCRPFCRCCVRRFHPESGLLPVAE